MKFKATTAAVLCTLGFCLSGAHAWQSDNGDGTFTNPPLYADYPDPDIICVGEDFYFATTTFVNSPGLTILRSLDLVNWEVVSQVIPRLEGREQYDLKNGGDYQRGIFAPSLRFHDGTFYCGTAEPERMYNSATKYRDAVDAEGIKNVYYESPGTSLEWHT